MRPTLITEVLADDLSRSGVRSGMWHRRVSALSTEEAEGVIGCGRFTSVGTGVAGTRGAFSAQSTAGAAHRRATPASMSRKRENVSAVLNQKKSEIHDAFVVCVSVTAQ